MSKPPCEADLALDADPERFGDAMVLCQDGSGSCAHTGKCSFEGECFKPSSIGYRRAHKMLNDLIDAVRLKEGAHVVVWLAHARNSMEHHYKLERDGWQR